MTSGQTLGAIGSTCRRLLWRQLETDIPEPCEWIGLNGRYLEWAAESHRRTHSRFVGEPPSRFLKDGRPGQINA